MSRSAIQHSKPRYSSASRIVCAALRSLVAKLMKIGAVIALNDSGAHRGGSTDYFTRRMASSVAFGRCHRCAGSAMLGKPFLGVVIAGIGGLLDPCVRLVEVRGNPPPVGVKNADVVFSLVVSEIG